MFGWKITLVCLWIVLNPVLRLWAYPSFSLKIFIDTMDYVSLGVLLFEGLSLWYLYGFPRLRRPQSWSLRPLLDALILFPLFWIAITILLFVLLDFGLLKDEGFGPLYDGQLFVQNNPISWTSFSFLASAILEEIFFRAWLPDFLEHRLRKSSAILLSAFLFMVAHVSLHSTALSLAAQILVALCLSYTRTVFGLSVAIGIHLLNNVLALSNEVFHFNVLEYCLADPYRYGALLLLCVAGVLRLGQDLRRLIDRNPKLP